MNERRVMYKFPYTDTFRRDNRFRDGLIAEAAEMVFVTYVPNDRKDGRHTWMVTGEIAEVVACAYEDRYNTVEKVVGRDVDVAFFWRRLEDAAAMYEDSMKVSWEQIGPV